MRSYFAAAAMMMFGVTAYLHAQTPVGTSAAGVRQTAYIKASNTEAGDHFGNGGVLEGDSVALSGDGNTLAVGAPDEASGAKGVGGNQDDNSMHGAGAVYVFTRNGNDWVQQAYVKASNPGPSYKFGHAIALSGDGNTMAVSAHFEASAARGVNGNQGDTSIPQAGAVYVFTRDGGRWSQQAYIKASNAGEAGVGDNFGDGDQFGFSLSISDDGNTLAVGATGEDSKATGINGNEHDNTLFSEGAAYVFTRTGATWTQQAYVKPSNTSPNYQFGYAVALSADGNALVVSSFNEGGASRQIDGPQSPGGGGTGALYVFARIAGTWKQTNYLKTSNAEGGDSLGVSVAISDDGNTIAATALDEDCMTTGVNSEPCSDDQKLNTSAGATYVFVRSGNTWTQQAFIKASNTGKDDQFGTRLTISGDGNTLAVAAQLEDSNARGINGEQKNDAGSEAGAVYVFTRSGTTWSQLAYVKAANNERFDEFGSSVALSRDGRIMAVGARGEDSNGKVVNGNQNDNSADEAGAVEVFAITPPATSAISRLDPSLDAIVSPAARIEVVKADHFGVAEGPLWIDESGSGYLLLSDLRANQIFKLTSGGVVSVFMEESGWTGTGAFAAGSGSNGITLDREGRLVWVAQGDRTVIRREKDGTRTVLADRYQGKRFNRPNDLAVKSDGAIYFTDPGGDPAGREIPFDGVYRLKDGHVDLLEQEYRPNGIAFSPDEKYLYVNVYGGKFIYRYDVTADGTVANRRLFGDMSADPAPGGADGLKVDQRGNVYCTGPGGLWIFSREGKHIGTILTAEPVGLLTNLAFGDPDGKTLYLTGRRTIARIRLNVSGVRPGAPVSFEGRTP